MQDWCCSWDLDIQSDRHVVQDWCCSWDLDIQSDGHVVQDWCCSWDLDIQSDGHVVQDWCYYVHSQKLWQRIFLRSWQSATKFPNWHLIQIICQTVCKASNLHFQEGMPLDPPTHIGLLATWHALDQSCWAGNGQKNVNWSRKQFCSLLLAIVLTSHATLSATVELWNSL